MATSVPTAPLPPPLPVINTTSELIHIAENQKSLKLKAPLEQCMEISVEFANENAQSGDRHWIFHNVNDVQPKLQGNAPRCGPVSLSMAAEMAHLSKHDTQSSNFMEYDDFESEIVALVNLAKQLYFSRNGEMFSAKNLGVLAKEFYGLNVRITDCGLEDIGGIVNHLCKGNPILVPYDASPNHAPCMANGHKAHWAVLTGFFSTFDDNSFNWDNLQGKTTLTGLQINGDETSIYTLKNPANTKLPNNIVTSRLHLLARQPKSRHVAVWPWKALQESNANLVEYCPDKECAKSYVNPKGGLSEGLCRKIIYLWLP